MDVLESLFRWIHIVAGIMWIGHLYFFNFVNAPFQTVLEGPLKPKVNPELMPRALFWLRWRALVVDHRRPDAAPGLLPCERQPLRRRQRVGRRRHPDDPRNLPGVLHLR